MYSRFLPSRLGRRGSDRRLGFAGNFAIFFPGAYRIIQSDRGLTYGGTPLATTGNTSTTVITLTGSLTVPVPVLVSCLTAGTIGDLVSEFTISLDGGFTTSQVITAPAVGVPVALAGAASGLFVAFSAGTCVLSDTWKATCAAFADQSGNARTVTQATAARQPVAGEPFNGHVSIDTDGADDVLAGLLPLPDPSVTPYYSYAVFFPRAKGAQGNFYGSDATGAGTIFSPLGAITPLRQYSGLLGNGAVMTAALTRVYSTQVGTAADALKIGAGAPATGLSAGVATGATGLIGAGSAAGAFAAPMRMTLLVYGPGSLSVAQLAAADAAANLYWGGVVI